MYESMLEQQRDPAFLPRPDVAPTDAGATKVAPVRSPLMARHAKSSPPTTRHATQPPLPPVAEPMQAPVVVEPVAARPKETEPALPEPVFQSPVEPEPQRQAEPEASPSPPPLPLPMPEEALDEPEALLPVTHNLSPEPEALAPPPTLSSSQTSTERATSPAPQSVAQPTSPATSVASVASVAALNPASDSIGLEPKPTTPPAAEPPACDEVEAAKPLSRVTSSSLLSPMAASIASKYLRRGSETDV